MMMNRIAATALLLAVSAAPLPAQSLFATRGLGIPVTPVDARAAALGGIGVGLLGFHTSLVNPAEMAGLTRRGVSAALQPVSTSSEVDGVEDGTSGTRFPMMTILYPLSPRLILAAGYGGYLDQSWGVVSTSTVDLNGQTVDVTDVLRSTGGITQLRVSASWELSPTFAVGVAGGLLTGHVDRTAIRSFEDSAQVITDFQQRLRWRFSAPIGVVGARWDAASGLRIGASALVGGDLSARSDDSGAEDRSYGSPLEVNGGVSARLTPLLMATLGGTWSRAPAASAETVSNETLRVGGGVEYQGVRSGIRTYPVRLGARWAQLPYHLEGEEQATEWGTSLGLGFRLGDPMDPAAVADIGVERATRSGLGGGAVDDVQERLWRFTFSLSIFAR
jgi:hypothetical protein